MKNTRLILLVVAVVFSAQFARAQTETAQDGAGGGGGDTSSANYQAKTAVGDPGVSESQSANYIYDHGTLWFDDGSQGFVPPPPSPEPVPVFFGGNSGSGWLAGLFGGDAEPGVGGVSPAADVPFTDTPESAAAVAAVPVENRSAVRMADAPAAIGQAVRSPRPVPQIIRIVDDAGVTREISIVLFKRIVPWPLWIALALAVLGALAIAAFFAVRGARQMFLRAGVALVLLGVITGVVVRFAFRAVPIDPTVVTSIGVVAVADADATVKKLMADLPIGVHVVKAADAKGKVVLTVTVFVTPALPI